MLVAAITAVALLAAAACAPSAPPPVAVSIPDTPVGDRTAWVIDVLNAEADTRPAQWAPVLHPDFLAEVSAEEVAALVNEQLRPAGRFIPTAYDGDDQQAVTLLEGRIGDPFELVIVLDDDALVTGLLFRPPAPPHTPATSIDEVRERLAALPGQTRALVRVDGAPVLELEPDTAAPLASVFKLWVLLAVAHAVDAGDLRWDDRLVVTDDIRSLPSGELQDAPSGTEVTVAEAALAMISISDNTATDLLIDRIGRDAVERAVAGSGHSDPAVMRPFPTTRELFQLMLGGADQREAWATADEDDRRGILAALADAPLPPVAAAQTAEPVWADGIDWFASASDVAAVHEALAVAADRHPEVAAALTENPGVVIESPWSTVAFKGGSSIGVLTGSWRASTADGAVMTVVILASAADAEAVAAAAGELFGLAEDLFRIQAASR